MFFYFFLFFLMFSYFSAFFSILFYLLIFVSIISIFPYFSLFFHIFFLFFRILASAVVGYPVVGYPTLMNETLILHVRVVDCFLHIHPPETQKKTADSGAPFVDLDLWQPTAPGYSGSQVLQECSNGEVI